MTVSGGQVGLAPIQRQALELTSNQTLYFEPGAVLEAPIRATDAENIRTLPDDGNTVLLEGRVRSTQSHPFAYRLTDQQAVDRVAVMERKADERGQVTGLDGQDLKSFGHASRHETVEGIFQFQPSQAAFDCDFPPRSNADEGLRLTRLDALSSLATQPPVTRREPQQSMGIDEQF